MQQVDSGYVCFTNGDIIVSEEWMNVSRRVFESTRKNETLIFGSRTDVNESVNLSGLDMNACDFVYKLIRILENHTTQDMRAGMDLVMVHSSFRALRWEQLPDFVIGLCAWDNHFMGWATYYCNTVAINFEARIFHVNHGKNACNDTNFELLRNMSRDSPYYHGFVRQSNARKRVKLYGRLAYLYDRLTIKRLGP
jgi:hypothetical protein